MRIKTVINQSAGTELSGGCSPSYCSLGISPHRRHWWWRRPWRRLVALIYTTTARTCVLNIDAAVTQTVPLTHLHIRTWHWVIGAPGGDLRVWVPRAHIPYREADKSSVNKPAAWGYYLWPSTAQGQSHQSSCEPLTHTFMWCMYTALQDKTKVTTWI